MPALDWSECFKFIYNLFEKRLTLNGAKATNKEFCAFLEISAGKLQKWTQGQWPKAPDLAVLHEKFGLSYRWLVTGEGDPFEESLSQNGTPAALAATPVQTTEQPPLSPDLSAEVGRLRKELEEERKLNRQLIKKLLESDDR